MKPKPTYDITEIKKEAQAIGKTLNATYEAEQNESKFWIESSKTWIGRSEIIELFKAKTFEIIAIDKSTEGNIFIAIIPREAFICSECNKSFYSGTELESHTWKKRHTKKKGLEYE